jgi:hypothetical protein
MAKRTASKSSRRDGSRSLTTMDAVPLYPKLTVGGFVIVDDCNLPMCGKAINDYREKTGIEDEIVTIDDACTGKRRMSGDGAYFLYEHVARHATRHGDGGAGPMTKSARSDLALKVASEEPLQKSRAFQPEIDIQ